MLGGVTVRGTFRRDLELAGDARGRGAFRLRRKSGARVASVLLAGASLLAGVLDLWLRHYWVAALQLALCGAFVWLLVRAEVEAWRFEDDALVLRHFTYRRFRFEELRVPAAKVRRVGVARSRGRARAWIETSSGEQYALLEGDEAQVEHIADSLSRLVLLASAEPPPPTQLLH